MCSTQEDAQSASFPIVFLIVILFLISVSLGLSNPSAPLAKMLSMIPFISPMLMFVRTAIATPSTIEIVLSIAINIASILLLTWLSAKIYRVGVLMYGKRPSLGEAFRWLKHS